MQPISQMILASGSPRRKELIALGGWDFIVQPAQVDEIPRDGETPADFVLRMAEDKARTVLSYISKQDGFLGFRMVSSVPPLLFPIKKQTIIIGADTIVVNSFDGNAPGKNPEIMGKPADEAEAVRMLVDLRGHNHQVMTAIAMLRTDDLTLQTDLCITDVPMRNYPDEEIAAYVGSRDPMDKAGAYAIQHEDFHPVESLSGCYANVMGLPLCHLTRLLLKADVQPKTCVPEVCQAALEYKCSIYSTIF